LPLVIVVRYINDIQITDQICTGYYSEFYDTHNFDDQKILICLEIRVSYEVV